MFSTHMNACALKSRAYVHTIQGYVSLFTYLAHNQMFFTVWHSQNTVGLL